MERPPERAPAVRTCPARLRRTTADGNGGWVPVTARTGRLRRLLMVVGGAGLLLALIAMTLVGALYLAPVPVAVVPAALALAVTVHVTVRARRNASSAPAHRAGGRPVAEPRPSPRARAAAAAARVRTNREPAWPTGRRRPVRPAWH